ncbi:MAG: hypothetical protein R3305_04955, partial [Gammaproteobacteria bacterium]|nr:hypothetical protein [Gammaproteobacteria bacterium]
SRSFSAANAWLGEEIRPIGAEWRMSRTIGAPGSPHQLDTFASMFYGNDPAATLLFWRGWSVHDRQTRLNERLPLPPLVFDQGSNPPVVIERRLDPIAELDDEPGFYAGGEWRHAQNARIGLAVYDNRADPYAFRDGQWGWDTVFWNLSLQVELPAGIGLIAQRMFGDTTWLSATTSDGRLTPATRLVVDDFDASFLLLSKTLAERHRITMRHERFDITRDGLIPDRGDATTVAYQYSINAQASVQLEWMQIDSMRELWPLFYGVTETNQSESLLQFGFRLVLFDSTR